MKYILILVALTIVTVNLNAQQTTKEKEPHPTKIDAFSSKTGTIIKYTDHKLSTIKSTYGEASETRVRVINTLGNTPAYFYQVEKPGKYSNATASIEYADLLEVIKALAVLKVEALKDAETNPDYLENKFTTVDGFQIGYYVNDKKIKWFLQLEKYGSDKTLFIDKVETIEAAFDAAQSKIQELKKI